MKNNPKLIALAQSIGLTAYVTLVVTLMQNLQNWFKPEDKNEILIGITMLLVFVTSALISASIMLGYPVFLFFKGKKKTAVKIVLMSVGWLVIFLVVLLISMSQNK